MKVGLLRHFRVIQEYPEKRLVTSDEVAQWFADYDVSDVEAGPVDLCCVDWKKCFTSDLPRAITTAKTVYHGDIITTQQLREIPPYPFHGSKLKLPFLLWAILVRLAWLFRRNAEVESKADVKQRTAAVLDNILQSQEDVLIVSHAALMTFLRQELRRRGFHGPAFRLADNGRLYVFENE